ncbi:DUF4190 domain-containing protein [Streptomyces sp. NPDC059009]|uniref:DUF4190 domain-containing protein n=1 Tax=Streptomyces sp. NPDC059009 TaxID=3346694 RepID=UPI0036CF3098
MSDPNAPAHNPYPQPQQPPAPGYGYPAPGAGAPHQYPAAPPLYGAPGPGYPMAMQPSNGMGTAGLVCGIIGVVLSLTFILWFIGIILGILGIVFGAIGISKANKGEATNKGAATGGLICGVVATVLLPLLGLILFASVMGAA